jgi:hypothetical protein
MLQANPRSGTRKLLASSLVKLWRKMQIERKMEMLIEMLLKDRIFGRPVLSRERHIWCIGSQPCGAICLRFSCNSFSSNQDYAAIISFNLFA